MTAKFPSPLHKLMLKPIEDAVCIHFFTDHLNFSIFHYCKQIPVCVTVTFHHFLGITYMPF